MVAFSRPELTVAPVAGSGCDFDPGVVPSTQTDAIQEVVNALINSSGAVSRAALMPGAYQFSVGVTANTNLPLTLEGTASQYMEGSNTTYSGGGVLIAPLGTFTSGYLLTVGSPDSNSGYFSLQHVELVGVGNYITPGAIVAGGLLDSTTLSSYSIPFVYIEDCKFNYCVNGINLSPNAIQGPFKIHSSQFTFCQNYGIYMAGNSISARLSDLEFFKCGNNVSATYNTGGGIYVLPSAGTLGSPARVTLTGAFMQDEGGSDIYCKATSLTASDIAFSPVSGLATDIALDTNCTFSLTGFESPISSGIPVITMYGAGYGNFLNGNLVLTTSGPTIVSFQSGFTSGGLIAKGINVILNGHTLTSPPIPGVPSGFSGTILFVDCPNLTGVGYLSASNSATGQLGLSTSSSSPTVNTNLFSVEVIITITTTSTQVFKNGTAVQPAATSQTISLVLLPQDSFYVSQSTGVSVTSWGLF